MPNSKEKQQIIMLSIALTAIIGVLLWMYGGKLLPQPDGGAAAETLLKIDLPASFDDPLFQRDDYKDLRGTPGVPVKPFSEIPRNPDPFKNSESAP